MNRKWPGRIRKTAWLALLLTFVFFISQFIAFFRTESIIQSRSQKPVAVELVVCEKMVDENPFAVDSVFSLSLPRLYAYSRTPGSGRLRHVWYWGSEPIQDIACPAGEAICISRLPGFYFRSGDWSLDLLAGDSLLATQQFSLVAETLIHW